MPDLIRLVVTHRAIRQDLGRLADCLGEDGGRDPRRAAALLRYTAALLAQVRAHNEGEVDFLWPVAAAAAGQAVDVAPLADDRHAVAAALVQVSQALDAVRAGHGAPADLHALLGRLRGLLDEHITDEEQQTFPAIRRYLRADTYQWCEKQMQRHSPLRPAGSPRNGWPATRGQASCVGCGAPASGPTGSFWPAQAGGQPEKRRRND